MAEEKRSESKPAAKASSEKTDAPAAKSAKAEGAKPTPKSEDKSPVKEGSSKAKDAPSKGSSKQESKPTAKEESRPTAKKESKPAPKEESKPASKKDAAKPAKKAAPAKKSEGKADEKDEDVTIVEEGEEAPKVTHTPRLKPELDDATRAALAKRRTEDRRRPAFRRQQWFEFKRLERSGWRKPTGQDSAMRRHFGYRPPVVRVGYRGPAAARGLHSSGFEEVRVENVADLERIDPKKQAARVSGSVGRRKLRAIYETAEKKKIRILNRRSI